MGQICADISYTVCKVTVDLNNIRLLIGAQYKKHMFAMKTVTGYIEIREYTLYQLTPPDKSGMDNSANMEFIITNTPC